MDSRSRPHLLKSLEICPLCSGYMRPQSAISGARVGGRHWKDETYHRSFGGTAIKRFVCEKCGHLETIQADVLGPIPEDD